MKDLKFLGIKPNYVQPRVANSVVVEISVVKPLRTETTI